MRWGTRCWTDGPGDDCYGSGRGLQIWMAPGFYGAYTYGEWVYTIPGYWETPQPTTYIAATTFSHMNINCRGDNNLYPYVIAGIYSPRAGNWTGYYAWPCGAQNFSYTQGPGNNVPNPDTLGGKTAAFALGTQYAAGRGTWADAYLGGAEIYLDDPEEPTLTGAPTHSINPAQWTDGTETRTVTASASDPGLGVKYFNLDRQDPAGWTFAGQAYHPCTATRAARCPRNWTAAVNYDTTQLPEGITNYRIVPYDPDFSDTPNPSTPWTVKIDRSEPAVDLGGSLSDNSARALVDGSYDVAIAASDGIQTDPESGVDRIEVLLDDDPYGQAAQQTQPADNATLSHSVSLQTETLDEGLHTVVVRATDRAGNVAEQELEFVVDHVVELPAQTLSPESASLRIDGEGNAQRAGTAVNAVGDLNGDDIDDFAIGAPSADPAGRTDGGTVHVVFGSDTAGSIDTASLGSGGFHVLGAQALDYTGASVAPAGDVNGDSYDDLLIGAPRVGDLGAPLSSVRGKAYLVYGGGPASDIDLASLGSRGFRVDGPLLDLPAISLQYDRRPTAFGEALGAAPATLAGGNHGDVNGDGLDDIIIGASAQNPQGRVQAGSAYVVLGSETKRMSRSPWNFVAAILVRCVTNYTVMGIRVSWVVV